MNKQTAVQLLKDVLNAAYLDEKNKEYTNILFNHALQMEREQIEEAYGDGLNAHRVDFCNRNEYYQKTYGGQDE
jgi:hypothetical protein